MLGQRLRRWPNIKPASIQCLGRHTRQHLSKYLIEADMIGRDWQCRENGISHCRLKAYMLSVMLKPGARSRLAYQCWRNVGSTSQTPYCVCLVTESVLYYQTAQSMPLLFNAVSCYGKYSSMAHRKWNIIWVFIFTILRTLTLFKIKHLEKYGSILICYIEMDMVRILSSYILHFLLLGFIHWDVKIRLEPSYNSSLF